MSTLRHHATHLLLMVGAVLTISAAGAAGAEAAGGSSAPPLAVSPAIAEWIIAPGETQRKTFRVINTTDRPMPVSVVAKSFDVQQHITRANKNIFNAASWLSFDEPNLIVRPKQTRKVTVTLHAPKNASVGGHYATAYFRQVVPVAAAQGAQAIGQVGSLMFIVVKGHIHHAVVADKPIQLTTDGGKRALALTLRNTGNVHVLPQGRIVIRDWRSRVIASPYIDHGVILPGTERTYLVPFKPSGAIGRYAVSADITYANATLPAATTKATIWILPPWRVWALLAWCVIFGLFIWRTRTRWFRAWRALRLK